MTNLSFFSWRFSLEEKFRVSQMQARMQNQNIVGYKIFKFKENAKLYFLS